MAHPSYTTSALIVIDLARLGLSEKASVASLSKLTYPWLVNFDLGQGLSTGEQRFGDLDARLWGAGGLACW